jgi:fucose 4-O-acetylase-like acetyltransferase
MKNFANSSAGPAAPGNTVGQSVETMRALATILLVSYHVIEGLEVSYPHPFRLFADFLVDVRMPLFAFIAGFVYAIRPVELSKFRSFAVGKFHRLLIPGAIAVTVFATFESLTGSRMQPERSHILMLYFLPYAHYWFLQAVFIIFLTYGLIDAISKRRADVTLFVLSIVIYVSGILFPLDVFSVDSALYLLPFFLLGVIVKRHGALIYRHRAEIVIASLAILIAATAWNLGELNETGAFSLDRRDIQSVTFGLAACAFLVIVLPRVSALEVIGPITFTIYLYHVFFTSAMRRALDAFGIEDDGLHFVLGVVAGVALPALMHLALQNTSILSRYILGMRNQGGKNRQLQFAEASRRP